MSMVALLLALMSAAISIAALIRVRCLEERSMPQAILQVATPISALEPNPLQGLKIGLTISQDHPTPVFATILRDCLMKEDADSVKTLSPELESEFDIVIEGEIVCNGYEEVYYEALLTCRAGSHTLITVSDKPANGDRPSNLALEFVSKLRAQLKKVTSLEERRAALRELGVRR